MSHRDPVGAPTIVRTDDAAAIGYARNLMVAAFWHSATLDHVDAMREATARALSQDPGFCTAVLVLDGEGVFSFHDDVRRELIGLVAETEDPGLGTAFVVLRGGFVGAAVRAFMTGVFLLSRTKEPNRAFARNGDAAGWLADRFRHGDPNTPWTAADLEDTLDRLLAHATASRQ